MALVIANGGWGVGAAAPASAQQIIEEVPAGEDAGVDPFERQCAAAGGVVEARPWPERNGTRLACVRIYTVRRGDWLWKVARGALRARGVRPTPTAVKTEASRIHEANASTIGPNPNRLLPGQTLRLLALDVGVGVVQGPTLR